MGMNREEAMHIILSLSEAQLRIALVEMLFAFYQVDGFNVYDFESILNIAKTFQQIK